MAYSLRKTPKADYKALGDIRLPQLSRLGASQSDKLYPVKVLEEEKGRVKLHYVGYGHEYDEWRDAEEVEDLNETETASSSSTALQLDNKPDKAPITA